MYKQRAKRNALNGLFKRVSCHHFQTAIDYCSGSWYQ